MGGSIGGLQYVLPHTLCLHVHVLRVGQTTNKPKAKSNNSLLYALVVGVVPGLLDFK